MKTSLLLCATLAVMAAAPGHAGPKGCPPGLAKKDPACVPPGLAKKGVRYERGDVITGDYIIVRDPRRWDLDPDGAYYRIGDTFYRIDRETREVLDVINALARLAD